MLFHFGLISVYKCGAETPWIGPEVGNLRQAHGHKVDISLSVKPSTRVLQKDGVDLTQRQGVGYHSPVHSTACLSGTHTQGACY